MTQSICASLSTPPSRFVRDDVDGIEAQSSRGLPSIGQGRPGRTRAGSTSLIGRTPRTVSSSSRARRSPTAAAGSARTASAGGRDRRRRRRRPAGRRRCACSGETMPHSAHKPTPYGSVLDVAAGDDRGRRRPARPRHRETRVRRVRAPHRPRAPPRAVLPSRRSSGTLTASTASVGLAVGGRRSEPLRGERQDQQRGDVRRAQDELLRHRVGEGVPDGGGRGEADRADGHATSSRPHPAVDREDQQQDRDEQEQRVDRRRLRCAAGGRRCSRTAPPQRPGRRGASCRRSWRPDRCSHDRRSGPRGRCCRDRGRGTRRRARPAPRRRRRRRTYPIDVDAEGLGRDRVLAHERSRRPNAVRHRTNRTSGNEQDGEDRQLGDAVRQAAQEARQVAETRNQWSVAPAGREPLASTGHGEPGLLSSIAGDWVGRRQAPRRRRAGEEPRGADRRGC